MKFEPLFAVLFALLLTAPVSGRAQGGFSLDDRDSKSEEEALKRSIQGTIYPVALGYGATRIFNGKTPRVLGASLAIYGLIVGPSFGNFYAEDYLRGAVGMGARMGAGLLLKDATREVLGANASEALGWDRDEISLGDTRILVGGIVMVGSMVYNIVTSRQSVREYNDAQISLRLTPVRGTDVTAPVLTTKVRF